MKADKSLDFLWSTIQKTFAPYYESEKEDLVRDTFMSGVVNAIAFNGFLPISGRENTGFDVNRTSTTEIGDMEAGNLGEGINGTGVISTKQCEMRIQAAGHRDLNAVGGAVDNKMVVDQLHKKESHPDDDVLLIDSFLDDEEVPSHSLFASVCLSSTATEVVDELEVITAREDTPGSSVESDSFEESEEGLFSEALHAYICKVGDNVPGLAVFGEVNFIPECFGHTLAARSSRYNKHIVAHREETYKGLAHREVLERAIVQCNKHRIAQKCPSTCHIRTVDFVSSREIDDSNVKKYGCKMKVSYQNHPSYVYKLVHCRPPRLQAEAIELGNDIHIPFRDIAWFLEENYDISINTKVLLNKMTYVMGVKASKQHERMQFCQELLRIREENSAHQVFLTIADDWKLESAAWTFREWLDD